MPSIAAELTPTDLLTLPAPAGARHYELSDGELIVVGNAGARHERIKRHILKVLFAYEALHSGGAVFSETQFTLGRGTARIPDVAFIRTAKFDSMPDADVAIPFAPDLAIDLISHSESADDAETKVMEYLAAGVEEVWQVYPKEQLFRVRNRLGIRDVSSDETLTSPVLPGFAEPVTRFFAR